MINKYGNDFKNNIFWNQEYPFIPEVTSDTGLTIHEDDIVEFYDDSLQRYFAARVYKIYSKDYVWTRFKHGRSMVDFVTSANEFEPFKNRATPPKYEDLGNQDIFNHFRHIIDQIYADLYPEELNLPNDWHFDSDKVDAKLREEVAKLKGLY